MGRDLTRRSLSGRGSRVESTGGALDFSHSSLRCRRPAAAGSSEIIGRLAALGADLNARGKDGQTPLIVVWGNNQEETAARLMRIDALPPMRIAGEHRSSLVGNLQAPVHTAGALAVAVVLVMLP